MSIDFNTKAASMPADSCADSAPTPLHLTIVAPSVSDDHDAKVLEVVGEYRERGWHVLPIDPTLGYCTWGKVRQDSFKCAPAEIGSVFSGMDVGLHLAPSKIVGIDIDCVEVVKFLLQWLPPSCVVGRDGKHCSWMFYRTTADIASNMSFRDCDENGKPIGELGGIKVNAVVPLPPSRHRKTQELLVWVGDPEPAAIESQQFVTSVRSCFAMALIARHWTGPKNRHSQTMALAGALLRIGYSVSQAIQAVRLLAELTNDQNIADRLGEVKSTYKRYDDGEDISGLPKLVELLARTYDERIFLEKNLRAWFGVDKADESLGGVDFGTLQTANLSNYIVSLNELLEMPLPEQSCIVSPWFSTEALIMLYAARGVGKTWVVLELAISVALGRDFLVWPVPKPRRVLLIDGEMPIAVLKDRLKKLLGATEVPSGLSILPSALLWRDDAGLNISQSHHQQRIDQYLAKMTEQSLAPDLIILDNLSSLSSGTDENSNSDLDQLLRWLVKLRCQGYSVLVVHHAGKSGDQRGASRREDLLDTVIRLDQRESLGLSTVGGACFELKFTKLRGEHPDPMSLTVALITDDQGNLKWQHEEGQKMPAYMKIVQGIYEYKPSSQSALAKQLGCTRQHISTQIKIGIEKGFLNKDGLSLTPVGLTGQGAKNQLMQQLSDAL